MRTWIQDTRTMVRGIWGYSEMLRRGAGGTCKDSDAQVSDRYESIEFLGLDCHTWFYPIVRYLYLLGWCYFVGMGRYFGPD